MPRRDGTGPTGTGPLTGWGAGNCGSGKGSYPSRGRGFRRFVGFCSPWHNWGMVPQANRPEILREQMESLEAQIKMMKDELKLYDESDE